MDMEKVAELVKLAKQSKEDIRRKARARYRSGGMQLRKINKRKQRMRRRQGGMGLKTRVKIQTKRLELKPVRIRKEPLQKRIRDNG